MKSFLFGFFYCLLIPFSLFGLTGVDILQKLDYNNSPSAQKIEAEMNRYLDIFKRHDLTKLAAAKPGLLEPRVNKGTKNVFDSIEEDSRSIDDLDDGLQLQSNP